MPKAPLEEVKNVLGPIIRIAHETPTQRRRQQIIANGHNPENGQAIPKFLGTNKQLPALQTPITRPNYTVSLPSAMKGVILTSTGELIATPTPTELVNLFSRSPRVGLGFAKILESDSEPTPSEDGFTNEKRLSTASTESDDVDSPPPSPTARKEREWKDKERERDRLDLSDPGSSTSSGSGSASSSSTVRQQQVPSSKTKGGVAGPPTRLRKPSIRTSTQRPTTKRSMPNISSSASSASTKGSSSSSSSSSSSVSSSSTSATSKPTPRQQQAATTIITKPIPVPVPVPAPKSHPAPQYDPTDEENLPSPFLKKVDKEGRIFGKAPIATSAMTAGESSTSGSTVRGEATKKRPSTNGANNLRALAAANVVRAASAMGILSVAGGGQNVSSDKRRPALLGAKRASEEARKILSRS